MSFSKRCPRFMFRPRFEEPNMLHSSNRGRNMMLLLREGNDFAAALEIGNS